MDTVDARIPYSFYVRVFFAIYLVYFLLSNSIQILKTSLAEPIYSLQLNKQILSTLQIPEPILAIVGDSLAVGVLFYF